MKHPAVSSQVALLEQKGVENYRCALLAEDSHYLNSAISRLYYSCLLLAKRCAYQLNWLSDVDFSDWPKNTHELIEEGYIQKQLTNPNIDLATIAQLRYLKTLKSKRKDAEYSPDIDYSAPLLKIEFESCKNMAVKFIAALEQLHDIIVLKDPTNE